MKYRGLFYNYTKMKYYLLTFNEDWADEHNVPALDCKTEEEYNNWLKTPSGKLNDDFQNQKLKYEENENLNNVFWETLKKENIENTMLIPKDRIDLINLEKRYRSNYKYIKYPSRVNSHINAWLGNSGDSFEEQFNNLYLMEEFAAKGIVEVTEVNENFYDIFHRANLSNLSLCNIFEL